MRTIWKYELAVSVTELKVPREARPLSAQIQHGTLTLWMLVDPKAPLVTRGAHVYGTGWDLGGTLDDLVFVGTVQHDDGLVWHVFVSKD